MSGPWFAQPMLAFDVETSGVSVTDDRIVTGALVWVGPDGARREQWVINPGIDIPKDAAAIHGWTTERVQKSGLPPSAVLETVAGFLADALRSGMPVVGMNLSFDLSMLECELERHGLLTLRDRLAAPIAPVVDVLVLDKQVDTYRKGGRKLTDLAAHYGVVLDDAHDAASDALASARIAYKIGKRFPEIGSMSLTDLHAAQIGWRREQQRSLADYFARQGKNETVDGGWPLLDEVTGRAS